MGYVSLGKKTKLIERERETSNFCPCGNLRAPGEKVSLG